MSKIKNEIVIVRAKNWIEKRNILNEIKSNHMTLQEVRLFTIYLSKINARDKSTRLVVFPLSDFVNIMGLQRIRIDDLQHTTDKLLRKTVNVPNEDGGYSGFQLFKDITLVKDKYGEWNITIDAHDKALPLMFEFKKNYFKYELWNTLRLTSFNQIRMYEILKQYENLGERMVLLEDLRGFLGIEETQYPRFGDFKSWVLEKTKQVLEDYTDICFEYELIKKGPKVISIKFIIKKNKNYFDQLSLGEFIDLQKNEVLETDSEPVKDPTEKDFSFFSVAFDHEFTMNQVKELYTMAVPFAESKQHLRGFDLAMHDYLFLKFRALNARENVKHRYAYIKKLIQIDLEDF